MSEETDDTLAPVKPKVKFSRNWQKQKRKVQSIHACIANIRKDYFHKVTTNINKNYAVIVIEGLKVKNLLKSAAGMVEQLGSHVRAKSELNRAILDQGWYEMRRQLEYKQRWRSGQVLTVPPPELRNARMGEDVNGGINFAAKFI